MDSVSYHPGPIDGSLLTRQQVHRSEHIWNGEALPDFRTRVNYRGYWDKVKKYPPHPDVLAAIVSSGFHGVYQIGAIKHDPGLITAFVERWRPETHTFHFHFGEATITLEDVYYILGLPTIGSPVVHSFPQQSLEEKRQLVGDLLGVYPVGDDVNRGGLKLTWLVDHFGACDRLDEDSVDFDRQLLFHIRAHLVMIIGSVFPNASGNRLQVDFLEYVRDYTEVQTYSWGSTVLAFLYKKLCSTSIGRKKDFCGCTTLLHVWIWERFPSLAPVRRDDAYIQHPLAMRWKVRLSMISVPHSQSRLVRYELDAMGTDEFFCWRPYRGVDGDIRPDVMTRTLWTSKCPLIFEEVVEWCYPERVTRQFGFRQDIPRASPEENHERMHVAYNDHLDWISVHSIFIQLWESRLSEAMTPRHYKYIKDGSAGFTSAWDGWYSRVTRRFIVDPRRRSREHGFQGTRGYSQYYAKGISQAYHAIQDPDPDVDEARTILGDRLTSTSCSSYQHTLPEPVPPLSGGQRGYQRHRRTGRRVGRPRDVPVVPEPGTYYDHVASDVHTSSGFVTESSTPHSEGGWGTWTQGHSYHQSQMSAGGGWGDTTPVGADGGWVPWTERHPYDQSQISAGGGRGGTTHGTGDGSWDAWVGGGSDEQILGGSQEFTPISGGGARDFGGTLDQSQLTHADTSQGYQTPIRGFEVFQSQSNAFSSLVIDPEGGNVHQRQQPPRHAKGKGRTCFTGSHMM